MDASQTTWISLTKFLSVVFASLFIATAHPKTVHSLFPKWLQVVYKPITGCDFWFLGVAPPYSKTLKAEEVVGGGIRSLCLSDSGHSGIFLQTLSKTLWLDFAITRRIVSAARTSLLRFSLSFPSPSTSVAAESSGRHLSRIDSQLSGLWLRDLQ